MTRRHGNQSGQILAGVIILLMVIMTLVPLMVLYTEREAKWSVKQGKTTAAFHLAEAGVEKAYRALTLSTGTWINLTEHGTQLPGFIFDVAYDDLGDGVYAVHISSGPDEKQATVLSIGKVVYGAGKEERRALRVVFQQSILGDVAIMAQSGVYVDGNNIDVNWGSVLSRTEININGRTRPQFWAASQIIGADTDPAQLNCDAEVPGVSPGCCQWHSFSTDLPPDPGVDIDFYRSSASATTSGCPSGVKLGTQDPANSCRYTASNVNFDNMNYTGGSTLFIEHNLYVKSAYVVGNLIVMGDFDTGNGNYGNGDLDMVMPQTAWKQYCRSWATYKGWDSAAAPAFPGLNSSYLSNAALNVNSKKVLVNGFMYIGGNASLGNGGGSADIYGVLYVGSSATLDSNSQAGIWYNAEAGKNIRTLKIILSRASWQAYVAQWPASL